MADISLPFILLAVWATVRYPGCVSLIEWNSERPIWSAFWTLVFAFVFFFWMKLRFSTYHWTLADDLFFFPMVFLPFYLRALIVAKKGWL